MRRHKPEDLEGRFTRYGAIALATAATEQLLTAPHIPDDVQRLLAQLCSELWLWQTEDKVESRANMSPDDARSLPSARLYTSYDDKLLALQEKYGDDDQLRTLLYAAQANLAFIAWQMDALEALLNPGKPFVGTCDIAEVGWKALSGGLNYAVEGSDNPQETYDWHQKIMAQLASDHPAPENENENGQPVARSYFFDEAPPEPDESSTLEDGSKDTNEPMMRDLPDLQNPDEFEGALTDYAAIAFATATIDTVLDAAASEPDVKDTLSSLVDDLWKWQTEDKPEGKEMSEEEEAKALPSSTFYARTGQLQMLADEHEDDPKVSALLHAAMDALDFIAWIMDGIERRLNPGKPFVLGEAGDREWEALTDALGWARKASRDPDKTAKWQEKTLRRLAEEYPGDPEREVQGEPVHRGYFSNAHRNLGS